MKKLVMLVAALMAVAFAGLNYESTAYANDRAIPSIGVSGGTDSISVVWTAPTDPPYDYRLAWGLNGGYISYKASNTSTAGNAYPGWSATSYTISGLDPGTYRVKLRARYDGSAGSWKAASSVVVTGDAPPVVVVAPDPTAEPEPPTSEQQQADPPAAPTGLMASQVAHDSVTLTWTAPSSGSTVTGYKVLRGTDANSLSAIAQDTGSAGAEYTDSTVAAETTYYYAVLALSADGDGAQSNTASATTPAPPNTPAPPKKRGDNRVSPRQTVLTSITLVSNTGQTNGGTGTLGSHDRAQAFTIGGNSAGYTLTSVEIDFATIASGSITSFAVSIWTDSSGAPGTSVGPLTGPASLSTTTPNAFTAEGSGLTLSANMTYFVLIDSTAAVAHVIQNTASDSEDSGAQSGWSIADGSLHRRTTSTTWNSNAESNKIAIKGYAKTAVTDATAPVFASAAANGTSLVITFDENLAAAASLANGAFTVKKTPSGGSEATVTLSTTTGPVISGKTVTLTLATALVSTDTAVKVTYTKPTTGSANKLVDAAANATADFPDQPVTNNTPALPVLVSNVGQATDDAGVAFDLGSVQEVAQRFGTGRNTTGYTLSSIELGLDVPSGTGYPTVTLHTGSAAGTKVADFTAPSTAATGVAVYAFTPTESLTLSASTTYWVRATGGDDTATWNPHDKDGGLDSTSAAGWSITPTPETRVLPLTPSTVFMVQSDAADGVALRLRVNGAINPPDATAPAFASAAANGTSLVITFDEDLAPAGSLLNSAFTVKKTAASTETTVTLSTTTGPVISGKTVTLTLATALLSTDTAVKVSYTKPTSGTANKLVDAAANETGTFTDQSVTNNTPATQTVTTFISNTGQTDVSGGLVVLSDFSYAQQFTTGGNPGGYTLSAVVVDIRTGSSTATQTSALHQSTTVSGVEVPETKVVDLSGSVATVGEQSFTPASTTTLSVSTKYFVVLSINGSTLIIHRTSSNNEDSGGLPGWEIANNSLRASNPVSTWTSVSDKLEIAVKGTAVPDTAAPVFASAAADGASLVITFDENLAAAASLANSAFTVVKKTSGVTETPVTLSTTVAPVISGRTVTLTLATALVLTDTNVKVSYTKPTSGSNNKLVDATGNETATFTDQPVTNNTPATDTTAPAFESAAANGTSLVITFDENLVAAASLANSAFTVKKTPSGGSEATVTLSTTVAPVMRAGR